MALVSYQNYTFPLRGLGQTTIQQVTTSQPSWFKRNWGMVLQVLGSLFVVSGTIIQQWINSNAPADEKISTDDWEMMVQAVQRLYPQLSRQQIEAKLCEVFGTRTPYCLPVSPVPPAPTTGVPSWIWLVAIGAGVFLLLK